MTPNRATSPKVIDLYCRISRDYDGTLRSVEAQEELGRADIAEHAHDGFEVGKVFRDHALSAWNPKVRRPDFDQLMTRLESGESDGVWVRNLDRFTRKVSEGERLLAVAEQGRIILAHDGRYDLTTARGHRHFREDMVDAAYESDRISERTTRGKRDKARRGKSNASYRGYGRPGFLPNPEGWEQGDPRVPVPEEQLAAERQEVRQMAKSVLAGDTLDNIARDLNDRGVRTVMGNQWTSSAIRQVLKSPSIAGLIEHQGVIVEGRQLEGVAALDRDTWERLQIRFSARKRGRPASAYLLSGLLSCGRCGAPLYGRPRTSWKPYPEPDANGDRTRREYWCQKQPGNAKSGCGRLNIDQRFADAVVEEATITALGDPRHADRLARQTEKLQAARGKIIAQIQRLEHDAESLAGKVATWGFERVDAAMQPIDTRLADLRSQLSDLETPEDLGSGAFADAEREWNDPQNTVAYRRMMVRRAFPKGITVKPATSRGRGALTRERFDWGR